MAKAGAVVASIACLGGASYLYATPYINIHQLQEAIETKDIPAIERHVNFPKLRESLKEQLKAKFSEELTSQTESNDAFAMGMNALGLAIASPIINAAVDTYVSPSGLSSLMAGRQPKQNGGTNEANSQPETGTRRPTLSMGYKSPNIFTATATDNENNQSVQFIFERQDLLSWRLSGISLPL